jgi:VanZ family protein
LASPSASRQPLYLAGAYTLLAIYGSLYPFSGWTDSGAPVAAFLTAAWPRHTTAFDIGINVAAYVPLGFIWVTALRPSLGRPLALIAAVAFGTLLSLGLETLQNFLPSRVPSNLDLACNATGTLVGAIAGTRWGATLLDGGRLHALRHRLFHSGAMADKGLLVVWLWLLTQFNPEILLFGNGDLRNLLDLHALPYVARDFPRIEAVIVAANTVAIALLVSLLAPRRAPVLAIVAAALMAKSFAFLLMMNGVGGLAWATEGSLTGVAVGLASWLIVSGLPARWRRTLAALTVLVAATLVNLAPVNPYLANTFQVWNPGQFLNFHGLTRVASNLWPFIALFWLILLRGEHELD